MPGATYKFDTATGSDTAASGYAQNAGLSVTAISGSDCNMTQSGVVNQMIYFTTHTSVGDTTFANAHAGDKLFVASASGRRWFTIGTPFYDSETTGCWAVIIIEASGDTTSTALNWGIGGSRQTLAGSLQLGADFSVGEKIQLTPGQTQTLTSTFSISAAGSTGGIITIDLNGATITSATTTLDLITFASGSNLIKVKNGTFTHSGATRGCAVALSANAGDFYFENCVVDGCLKAVNQTVSGAAIYGTMVEVKNSTLSSSSDGAWSVRSAAAWLLGCWIHDNPSCCGVGGIGTGVTSIIMDSCVVSNNGVDGVHLATTNAISINIADSIIVANGGDNVFCATTTANGSSVAIYDNIIYGAGGYNIHFSSTTGVGTVITAIAFNAVGGATSGNYSNFTGSIGPASDIALNDSSIFNNYAGKDFTINQANAAAAGILNVGFPTSIMGQTSKSAMGAVQMQPASGGGGGGGTVNAGKMGLSL